MLEAIATPHNRRIAAGWLVVAALCAIGTGVVGIADNPPGIVLAMLAACGAVLALVHPWRESRRYRFLLYGAVAGFVVFAILHNVAEVLATRAAGHALIQWPLQGLSVVSFLVALLVCPPAMLVGAGGAVVTALVGWRRRSAARAV